MKIILDHLEVLGDYLKKLRKIKRENLQALGG
jgi:hypothetical protein